MAEIRSSRPSDELAVERVVTERLNERGEPVIQIMAKFLDRNPRTFKPPVTPIGEWHRHEVLYVKDRKSSLSTCHRA